MKEKMKDKIKGSRENEERSRKEVKNKFFQTVSGPSNPPDELAQNVSKKIPFGRIIPPFFLRKFRV